MTLEATDDGVLPTPIAVDDFDTWVAPHLPLLRVLAAREIGDADADDVVQDALVRAWRRRDTFDPSRGSARAWLIAVLLDQVRRRRSRVRVWPVRSSSNLVLVLSDSGLRPVSSSLLRHHVDLSDLGTVVQLIP